jgi:hypothetical protein
LQFDQALNGNGSSILYRRKSLGILIDLLGIIVVVVIVVVAIVVVVGFCAKNFFVAHLSNISKVIDMTLEYFLS